MADADQTGFWSLLEAISGADSVPAVREAVLTAFAYVGFRAAYFLAPVVPDPRIGRVLENAGFPAEWEARYRAGDYLFDPIASHAITRRGAFAWPDGLPVANLKPETRAYLGRLADYGMERGIGVPCFGPFARVGFVGVGLPDQGMPFDEHVLLKIEIAARLSHQRYLRLIEPFPPDFPSLSERETEVMALIAQGKSNGVIAALLGIAPSSVDVYVKRIFAKLGVADRTSASVRALALGLVVTGEFPGQAD